MAKIQKKQISWPGSASPDVTRYKVYMCPNSEVLDYDSQFVDVDLVTSVVLNDIFPDMEGTFHIGVTAVDGFGNESDMEVVKDIPLDLSAPAGPGPITIIDL